MGMKRPGSGIMEVFTWKAPEFQDQLFVVRVGDWGGHMLVDCDDPATIHGSARPGLLFIFEATGHPHPGCTVRVELEAIAWRDGLKRK